MNFLILHKHLWFDFGSSHDDFVGHPDKIMPIVLKLSSFSFKALINEVREASSLRNSKKIIGSNFHYFGQEVNFNHVDDQYISGIDEAFSGIKGIEGNTN